MARIKIGTREFKSRPYTLAQLDKIDELAGFELTKGEINQEALGTLIVKRTAIPEIAYVIVEGREIGGLKPLKTKEEYISFFNENMTQQDFISLISFFCQAFQEPFKNGSETNIPAGPKGVESPKS